MYFETDYFGAVVGKAQQCWKMAIVFDPQWADVGSRRVPTYETRRWPINRALGLLGVGVEPPARDEFETIGLQRSRDTEGWIERA
jgi:hypothetical protein